MDYYYQRFLRDVDTEYFYYVLSSEIAQKQLFDSARGGVVKNLNTTRMSTIKIPLPPMPIQLNLVKECNKIEDEINTLRKAVSDKHANINLIIRMNYLRPPQQPTSYQTKAYLTYR
ncbi:MAG: restriction endonuclease subunit S [Waltera sp.]